MLLFSNTAFAELINEGYKGSAQAFVNRLYSMKLHEPLGLPIEGEQAPLIRYPGDKGWSGLSLAWMSHGYEVLMTPLQVLAFYNAIANYENDKKGLFAYFTHRNALSLLADNPQILKDMELVKATNLYGNKSKGTNSGVKINAWGRRLQADYMLEPAYDEAKSGLLNLHKIRSVGYIKEAIGWNEDGNFDRVSAMGMLMILREEYKKYKLQVSENMLGNKINNLSVDPFFANNYNNKSGIASNVKHIIMENSYNDLSKYDI
jgi:hypothetical protein